jgi:dTDP-4-dehydrorhamnose reductase
VESDAPNPLNVYGRSKAEAERRTLAAGGKPLVVRTAAFFSPHDPHNFAAWVVRELSAGRPVRAAEDAVVSPTYVPDLVRAAFDLLIDGETGHPPPGQRRRGELGGVRGPRRRGARPRPQADPAGA